MEELQKFPEDIYKGFDPKPAKPLKRDVKKVVIKPVLTDEEMTGLEGTHFTDTDHTIKKDSNGNFKVNVKGTKNPSQLYTIFSKG